MKLESGGTPLEALRNTARKEVLSWLEVEGWRELIADHIMPSRQKEVILADNAGITWVDWTPQEVLEVLVKPK